MGGMTLLQKARSAGLSVCAEGNLLRIKGPRHANEIAIELLAHKQAVIEALREELPAQWHEIWDERSAIMEYEGDLPREQAEAQALKQVLAMMQVEQSKHSPNA